MPTSSDAIRRGALRYGSYIDPDGPTIECIATHVYRQRKDTQKELKFATSFQKSQDYIDSLREEVNGAMFRDSIDDNPTPSYVFEELSGIHHSPEHPLITRGLLASTKAEQFMGYAIPTEKVWPSSKPRPQASTQSFYRPNSTHNYLTKTITLGGSHDGFNPKLGTPTRAQLLRNRVRFTAAPDLTYSYLAQKRLDGKREAVHRKNKLEEDFLQLKSSKVEMDKTAGKYRKFMIGSQYNTAKWIESHVNVVHDLIAVQNLPTRPASSVTPVKVSAKVCVKRRAVSAVANNRHMRQAGPFGGKLLPEREDVEASRTRDKQTLPSPLHTRSGSKFGPASAVTTRSANLVPYTTAINSPGRYDHLDSAITIKSIQDVKATQDARRFGNRLDSAKQLNNIINSAPSSANPVSHSSTPRIVGYQKDLKQPNGITNGHTKKSIADSRTSKPFFVTNPQVSAISNGTTFHALSANSDAISDVEIENSIPINGLADNFNDQTSKGSTLTHSTTKPSMSIEITTSSKLANSDAGPPFNTLETVTRTHSVTVELPAMENTSDTLSQSLDAPTEGVEVSVPETQTVVELQKEDNYELQKEDNYELQKEDNYELQKEDKYAMNADKDNKTDEEVSTPISEPEKTFPVKLSEPTSTNNDDGND